MDLIKSTADHLGSNLSKVKPFSYPTKYLHILVPAPLIIMWAYLHQLCAKKYVRTEPPKGVTRDNFSEECQHHSMKKEPYVMPN